MPPPGVKGEVMNETNATMTGTAGAAEIRSPKSEVRPAATARQRGERKSVGPDTESRNQPAGDAGLVTGATPGSARSTLHAPRSHRLALTLLAAALTTAVAWAGYQWLDHVRTWVKTDNAYVAAHVHQVSSRVAGTVSEVLVEENDVVEAGRILARLDARDFDVKQQQALAQVAQAEAHLQQAEAQVAQGRAQVSREQAQATKAMQDLNRAKALAQGANGAISKQELDAAQAAGDAAQAALDVAKSALQSAEAATAASRALQQVAQANLKDAELQLSYTEIRAPAAGRIGKKNLETGNRVQPGQALLALVQPDVWVVANFKETQLARLKPGQPVRLRVDAFPGRNFAGHVESLAPASGAQFALLPPDNATGNFIKIVQRVPVKIALDPQADGDCAGRIVPGMSTVVEVKVRE
jgi:membrane fusion protein, multidrug efflux system